MLSIANFDFYKAAIKSATVIKWYQNSYMYTNDYIYNCQSHSKELRKRQRESGIKFLCATQKSLLVSSHGERVIFVSRRRGAKIDGEFVHEADLYRGV